MSYSLYRKQAYNLESNHTNQLISDYINTKKALAGLFGLLGSFSAFPFFICRPPAFSAAFLFTESLLIQIKITQNKKTSRRK